MGVHEDRPSVWRDLPSQQIDYYRKVLAVHANDAHSGTCPVCRIPRCFDWRKAYEILTTAGLVLVDPDQPGDDEPGNDS